MVDKSGDMSHFGAVDKSGDMSHFGGRPFSPVFRDHLNQFPLSRAWNPFNPDKLKVMGRQEVAEDAKQLLLPLSGHACACEAKQDRGAAADDHLELTDLGNPLEQVIPEKVADAAAVGQSDEAGGAAEQFPEAADTGFVHKG